MDIRKSDRKALALTILNPVRLWQLLLATGLAWIAFLSGVPWLGAAIIGISFGILGYFIAQDFLRNRWKNLEHYSLWEQIRDRMKRLRRALKRAPQFARESLESTPNAIKRTSSQLFISLRKADLVKSEIVRSEAKLGDPRLRFGMRTQDKETSELYSLADRNVADYRRYYDLVSSRVTRVEAQCAVFVSALDALRMRLLNYRLLTKDQPQPADEFGDAVDEIRVQLASIDSALQELDLYPALSPDTSESDRQVN